MTILLVSRTSDDHCTSRVEAELAARGFDPVRLDSDRFPGEIRAVGSERGATRARLLLPGRTLALAEVRAVWNRRFNVGERLPEAMDPALRQVSIAEAERLLESLICELPAPALDPLRTQLLARDKLRQLALARELGLRVPRTCVTNDPGAVRALAAACPGGIVAKMSHNFAVDTEAGEATLFTSSLGDEDLAALEEGLALCPMIFQERVAKACELRVVVVGQRTWCAGVESPEHAGAGVDWRRVGAGLVEHWRARELPVGVRERVLALTARLGLAYAALDIIVTPEGEHVFLEVNPRGEYFWLEDRCGFAISAAIADDLADAARSFPGS